MIKLRRLIILQAIFACASLCYLLLSLWRLQSTGEALSAAAIGPSIAFFVAYSLALGLPHFGFERIYRATMIFALLFFGGGGVIGNIARYLASGLEQYSSFSAFLIAVAINSFGTILNFIALCGWYTKNTDG